MVQKRYERWVTVVVRTVIGAQGSIRSERICVLEECFLKNYQNELGLHEGTELEMLLHLEALKEYSLCSQSTSTCPSLLPGTGEQTQSGSSTLVPWRRCQGYSGLHAGGESPCMMREVSLTMEGSAGEEQMGRAVSQRVKILFKGQPETPETVSK